MTEPDVRPPDSSLTAASPQRRLFFARLAAAVRRQDWFVVALEIAIVVLGVVIGFQVTAWGNERAARTQEQELLRGLRAEFEEVAVGLHARLGTHDRVEVSVRTTLDSLTAARDEGRAFATVSDTMLAWVFVPPTTQFSQGVLTGAVSTGRLGLVRDRELQSALAAWDGVLEEMTEDETGSRAVVMADVDPAFWSRMDTSPFRNNVYRVYRGERPEAELRATSEVPVDAELMGVLTTRLHWQQHTMRAFAEPQAEAQRILGLIDAALDR